MLVPEVGSDEARIHEGTQMTGEYIPLPMVLSEFHSARF